VFLGWLRKEAPYATLLKLKKNIQTLKVFLVQDEVIRINGPIDTYFFYFSKMQSYKFTFLYSGFSKISRRNTVAHLLSIYCCIADFKLHQLKGKIKL